MSRSSRNGCRNDCSFKLTSTAGAILIGMNVIDLALQGIHGTILGIVMIAAGLFMIGLFHLNVTLGGGRSY